SERRKAYAETLFRLMPRDASQTNQNFPRGLRKRLVQISRAIRQFVRQGFVSGWGAAKTRGNQGIVQLKPIVPAHRHRLVRKSGAKQGPEQPIATAVASEHPACSVSAVSRRSEAENQQRGIGVAEIGQRP